MATNEKNIMKEEENEQVVYTNEDVKLHRKMEHYMATKIATELNSFLCRVRRGNPYCSAAQWKAQFDRVNNPLVYAETYRHKVYTSSLSDETIEQMKPEHYRTVRDTQIVPLRNTLRSVDDFIAGVTEREYLGEPYTLTLNSVIIDSVNKVFKIIVSDDEFDPVKYPDYDMGWVQDSDALDERINSIKIAMLVKLSRVVSESTVVKSRRRGAELIEDFINRRFENLYDLVSANMYSVVIDNAYSAEFLHYITGPESNVLKDIIVTLATKYNKTNPHKAIKFINTAKTPAHAVLDKKTASLNHVMSPCCNGYWDDALTELYFGHDSIAVCVGTHYNATHQLIIYVDIDFDNPTTIYKTTDRLVELLRLLQDQDFEKNWETILNPDGAYTFGEVARLHADYKMTDGSDVTE